MDAVSFVSILTVFSLAPKIKTQPASNVMKRIVFIAFLLLSMTLPSKDR